MKSLKVGAFFLICWVLVAAGATASAATLTVDGGSGKLRFTFTAATLRMESTGQLSVAANDRVTISVLWLTDTTTSLHYLHSPYRGFDLWAGGPTNMPAVGVYPPLSLGGARIAEYVGRFSVGGPVNPGPSGYDYFDTIPAGTTLSGDLQTGDNGGYSIFVNQYLLDTSAISGVPIGMVFGRTVDAIGITIRKADTLSADLTIIPKGGHEILVDGDKNYTFIDGADYDVQWTTTGAASASITRDGVAFSTSLNGAQRFDDPKPGVGSTIVNYSVSASDGATTVSKDRSITILRRDFQLRPFFSNPSALLTPAEQTVTLGRSATLTPSIPDSSQVVSSELSGDGVRLANPSGVVSVTPSSYGDKIYAFVATGRASLRWDRVVTFFPSLVLHQPDGTSVDVTGRAGITVNQSGLYSLTATDSVGNTVTSDPVDVVIPTASANATVHVRLPRTVTFSDQTMVYRDTITLAATTNGDGAPTYSLVSGPATLTGANLTATSRGTAVVKVDYPETATYEAGSAQANVTINPRPVNLAVIPASFEYDGATKTLTYTVDDPRAITEGGIDASGLTGGPDANTYDLTVRAIGNYAGSATGKLTITPAAVVGSWSDRVVDGPYVILTSDLPAFAVKRTGALVPGTIGLSWSRKDDGASGSTFVGDSIFAGNYTVAAHFTPSSPNYQSADLNSSWGVTLAIGLHSSNASLRFGAESFTDRTIRALPGAVISATASPISEYAWGDTWDDPTPRIWSGPASIVGAGTDPTCTFTVPAAIASLDVTASAYQVPARVTLFTPMKASYTVPTGIAAGRTYNRSWQDDSGRWKAYLGRDGVTFSLTGQVREGPVQGFQIEAKSPMTDWTVIASADAGTGLNGPRVEVNRKFSLMLGKVREDKPLIPADKGQVGLWQFRARVQRTSGAWSDYASLDLDAVWPLVTIQKELQTLPPAGPDAAWFTPSDVEVATFHVWVP